MDKEIDLIEHLKIEPPILGEVPPFMAAKSFLVEIKERILPEGGTSRYLHMIFYIKGTRYTFNTYLTADEIIGQTMKHRYRTFQRKLIQYFGEGNKDVLLDEINKTYGVKPDKKDYKKIWEYLHTKVMDFICGIDFWDEIHR